MTLADVQVRQAMEAVVAMLQDKLAERSMPAERAPGNAYSYLALQTGITDTHAADQRFYVFGAVVVSEQEAVVKALFDSLQNPERRA